MSFFPIMAWNWIKADPAALRRMRDNGLTVAGFVRPTDLDAVHAAGLKAIVADPRLSDYDWLQVAPEQARANVAAVIAEVGDHPAVFGYYLKDEPCADQFAGLAVVADEVRRLAPGKWPYINLLPDYANARQLGAATYEEHLAQFVATCRPPILSYDNYSLMERQDVRTPYWTNLESMRNASTRHNIPFWNIVLSVAHFQYRELSAADARFQAYTTLAYGGRGLSYFTYFAPECGNYRMAPVDQFGAETPTWYYLQHVNRQIEHLAPTLLQLRSDAVYHFGQVPAGTTGPSTASLVSELAGADFLVGDFTHVDGSRYALIVNTSFHASQWCHPRLQGAADEDVSMVSPYTGQRVPFLGEQKVLAPGQGVLLRVG